MKQSALQILETLIGFRSVSGDYDGNHEAIEYIDRFLSERGMHVRRFAFNGVESLVATTKRTKKPAVLLAGHIDVVAAPDNLFTLQREDGKLVGRGVVDMKAAIAAYLQVVDDLQDSLDKYDFGLMIVSDEEVGGFNGAQRLIDDEGYRANVCVLPDGGSNWAMETFAKAVWFIDVTASGKAAHGSRPWEGENAADKLLHVIAQIKELFPQNSRDTNTCTLSKLQASDTYNLIPATATASFDIRLASIEDDKNIRNAVALICEQNGVELKEVVYAPACANDPDNPYLRSFAESLEKVVGYPTGTTISMAGSDGRFFTPYGVPCAIFYPAGGGHHSENEWIPEEAYEQLQALFHDFLEKEAKISTPDPAPAPELEIAHL